MTIRSREQERAGQALDAVEKYGKNKLNPEKYANRAKGLPAMLHNLGLAATIATLGGSSEDADKALADDLAAWLLDGSAGIPWPDSTRGRTEGAVAERLERAISAEETSWLVYRFAEREARLYAGWLKQWSRAEMEMRKQQTASRQVEDQKADGEPADSELSVDL